MAYINDNELLNFERVRAKLRDNLRLQGIECADDEPMDSLAGKVVDIQSFNDLLDRTLVGKIINITTETLDYRLTQQPYITEVIMTKLTLLPVSSFNNCFSLKAAYFPLVSSTEISASGIPVFSGTTIIEQIVLPRLQTVGPYSFGYNQSLSRELTLVDFGEITTLRTGYTNLYDSKLKYLILRNSTAVTLSGTNVFTSTPFMRGGGKLFVQSNKISDYENGTNWSSLTGMTVISLEGSRFEDLDWFDKRDGVVTLDENEIEIIENETVAMFKHTENLAHIYENGIELSDNELMSNHRVVTTTA